MLSPELKLKILSELLLTSPERMILEKSFRTRIKEIETGRELQLRVDPEEIDEREEQELVKLTEKLTELLISQELTCTLKLSACCQTGCMGCTRFESVK
jgi:hypothetical protein